MKSKDIMNRLKKHWEYVIQKGGIPKDKILGIFLFGSQNYGTALEGSDIDSKVIYVPSFEQFCLLPDLVSKDFCVNNNEHIDLKDVRLMRGMFMKQHINYIQILFTKYFILNPKYADIFTKYFLDNAEVIAHYDIALTIKQAAAGIFNFVENGRTDHKALYNGWRLYYFLKDYLEGKTYPSCICQTGKEHDMLMSLKLGTNRICESKTEMSSNAYKLSYETRKLIESYPNVESPLHQMAGTLLKEGTMEIIKLAFRRELNNINGDLATQSMLKNFLDSLSNYESKVLKIIMQHIGPEGITSVSNIMEETGISRTVFTNLFNKMRDMDVATVKKKGGGTYISFTIPELRKQGELIRASMPKTNDELYNEIKGEEEDESEKNS